MGENSDADPYVVEVDREVDSFGRSRVAYQEEQWKKHCIYRLPAWMSTKGNENNAYKYMPQVVSFGPYHYGNPDLKAMEYHKHRAVVHFLRMSCKKFRDCVQEVRTVVQDLKAAYASNLGEFWARNSDEFFLLIMIRDGCFMLEIMRRDRYQPGLLYAENDPIFSVHGEHLMPLIKRDMLLLENQLPMLLLHKLLAFEHSQQPDGRHQVHSYINENEGDRLNKLLTNFFSPAGGPDKKLGECKHLLDAYRKCLLWEDQNQNRDRDSSCIQINACGRESTTTTDGDQFPSGILGILFPPPPPKTWIASIILPPAKLFPLALPLPSATDLREAGITITPTETGNIKAISFDNGILRLPRILVDDLTETVFLNLIAFERFHLGIGDEVSSYAAFMDEIIENVEDAKLLQSLGIIRNSVGSEEAIAKLFNSIATDVALHTPDSLSDVRRKATHYANKSWNKWRANLIHTYFQNPWTIIAVTATALLFGLTVLQTIYTMGQFYQGQKK